MNIKKAAITGIVFSLVWGAFCFFVKPGIWIGVLGGLMVGWCSTMFVLLREMRKGPKE